MRRYAFVLAALALLSVQFGTLPSSAAPAGIIYGDGLAEDWANWSWGGDVNLASGANAHSGSGSVAFTLTSGWGAFSPAMPSGRLDIAPFNTLRFYVHGGSAGNQKFVLRLGQEGYWSKDLQLESYITGGAVAAGEWRLVEMPISDFELLDPYVDRLALMDPAGQPQPTIYLDDIEFYHNGSSAQAIALIPEAPPVSLQVKVDAAADRHDISSLIYGLASYTGSQPYFKEMNPGLVRWGGNDRTRHNWEINATNAGSDWFFANKPLSGGDTTPGRAADDFVLANRAMGAETLLTIPTMGWVSRDGDNNTKSVSLPAGGGAAVAPGSEAIAGYDPAGNRQLTSIPSYPRKGAPFAAQPDPNDGAVYQDEWVNHLKTTLGAAGQGGVRLYAMDNEPDLWADNTHMDVRPTRAGYDEVMGRFLEYARAVKAVDPGALVTGPVSWGWTGYWYSGLDRGNDNFATAADRKAHGDVPFIPWFLSTARDQDAQAGQRSLDVLDIHYYPQGNGVYAGNTDKAAQALRLRSTRSLWDPNYVDESWIGNTKEPPQVMLIPRMKAWIEENYPGTKLGITEWNFGADHTINGALAIADVLGIFGREDVYLANYWTAPKEGRPGYFAFRMFRNYDGADSSFGDVSVKAASVDQERLASYASLDSSTGEMKLMLVNKMPDTPANVSLSLSNFAGSGAARVYRYSAASPREIVQLGEVPASPDGLNLTVPPYSITLLVFPPAS